MTEWFSGAFFVTGAVLTLISAVGVVRMPDVFTRMQASTKASTLGLGLLLLGLAVRRTETAIVIRALSIAAFLMLTTAVSAHVIARAAALTRAPLWPGTRVDERRSDATAPPNSH